MGQWTINHRWKKVSRGPEFSCPDYWPLIESENEESWPFIVYPRESPSGYVGEFQIVIAQKYLLKLIGFQTKYKHIYKYKLHYIKYKYKKYYCREQGGWHKWTGDKKCWINLIRKHSTHVRKYQRRNLIKLWFHNYNIYIK